MKQKICRSALYQRSFK